MKVKKVLGIVAIVVVLVALIGSGWVYNVLTKNAQLIRSNEMATLQTTFVQQYGSGAKIQQLVAPDKVYAAMWTDGDGVSHVSWCVGGVWATVWSSPQPSTSP